MIYCSQNNSPRCVSSFEQEIYLNSMLYGIDLIHSGINLQWSPKTSRI